MVSLLFKWSAVFSLFTAFSITPVHPVYMSVTEIDHNAKDQTLEISCKIFTDDFEKTLRLSYNKAVDLIHPSDKTAMNKLVSEYVQMHLTVKVDGKNTNLQFLGYEQQEEGIISYFQAGHISTVKRLDITDNLLYEYKDQQISLLHVTVNGSRKSTKLVNPEEKVILEW